VKRLVVAVVACAATFGAVTWLALEASGVAVLRTHAADGAWRTTRVWYAEHDGALWVEAATPERDFVVDLRRNPDMEVVVGGAASRYRGEVVDAPSGHDTIRALLREKYGVRDWWIGLLQDTSRSLAVKLHPVG
jgi:hypothetical protein